MLYKYYDKAVLGSAAVFGIIEDLVSDQERQYRKPRLKGQDLSQTIDGVTYTTRYSTATAAVHITSHCCLNLT